MPNADSKPMSTSERMRLIRSKNTKPEMVVRKLLYQNGYRYRLNVASLAGVPDLVFYGRRKLIFVHGCFWHQHLNCKGARMPKTNVEYWVKKLAGNVRRDESVAAALIDKGWSILTVWECETRNPKCLLEKLIEFLESK